MINDSKLSIANPKEIRVKEIQVIAKISHLNFVLDMNSNKETISKIIKIKLNKK